MTEIIVTKDSEVNQNPWNDDEFIIDGTIDGQYAVARLSADEYDQIHRQALGCSRLHVKIQDERVLTL